MQLTVMYPTRLLQPRTSARRTTEGTMSSYVHAKGRVGVLVEVNCETQGCAKSVEFTLFARWIAEHIAAAAPMVVERDELPSELVTRRHRTFVAEALASCRSEADESAAGLLVERRMEALYRGLVLMEQPWNRNPALTIGLLTAQVASMSGECIRVRRFSRFHMGMA